MTTIKFKLLHEDAKLPTRATEHAAAYDVVAASREIKDGYVHYGLGFATELPVGWQGKFYARSGISNYDLILCNGVGVIDTDYRGEWSARFKLIPQTRAGGAVNWHNPVSVMVDSPRLYKVGERIGQIQFERVPELRFEAVETLSNTERAAGGFGSTGK